VSPWRCHPGYIGVEWSEVECGVCACVWTGGGGGKTEISGVGMAGPPKSAPPAHHAHPAHPVRPHHPRVLRFMRNSSSNHGLPSTQFRGSRTLDLEDARGLSLSLSLSLSPSLVFDLDRPRSGATASLSAPLALLCVSAADPSAADRSLLLERRLLLPVPLS
jgi:hypothetical protein